MTFLPDTPWVLPVVRGLAALVVFALAFVAARYRWRERETDHGPGDLGLD